SMQCTSKVILYFVFLFASCSEKNVTEKHANTESGTRIAFMSDVHLLDIHGTLKDIGYGGIRNPKTDEYALIRTMDAQLHSTRLFNENYFAFRAALDDAVKRGIKLIALPGDFSDDGQPLNVRGLNRILEEYSENHDMAFFLTTGNHDPNRPFDIPAGKSDFLGKGGKAQPIMSKDGMYVSNPEREHPILISEDIKALGYAGVVNGLQDHGFFPKKTYRYWETPFSEYNYENYSLEKAKEASHLKNRNYTIAGSQMTVPDVSYLVEPVDGLWLLALDGNVYLSADEPNQFQGAGIGYNEVLEHKKHLVVWAEKVAKKAKKLGKSLIAFSHYPMVDFNDGASQKIAELLGENALQAHRIPDEKVAEVFADAGVQVHIGGHMHLNDTGIYESASGNTLVNIQVPSLAAYKPAYKIATITTDDTIEIETVVLDSVPSFSEFFELYGQEHRFLESLTSETIWDKNVLKSKNYHEYTNWHLKELVRLRFLPEDWPPSVQDFFLEMNGEQLLILSRTGETFSRHGLRQFLKFGTDSPLWNEARESVQKKLSIEGLQAKEFKDWTGFDLIYDFYRLRNADKLAVRDIGKDRLKQYQLLLKSLENNPENPNFHELWIFGSIFQKQLHGEPAMNFIIDLKDGGVSPD
uniref:metallophosphoesterase n=1 Tax=Pricia sp. TaxID=2268138 RepID=UPI00359361E7